MKPPIDPRRNAALAAFMLAFAEGNFFEAHEILEEFWVGYQGSDRDFYRGLIQAAVALHHLSAGNAVGARGVAVRARKNLAPYAPRHASIELDAILKPLEAA